MSAEVAVVDASAPEARLCEALAVTLADAGEIAPPAPPGFVFFVRARILGSEAEPAAAGDVSILRQEHAEQLCQLSAGTLTDLCQPAQGHLVVVKLWLPEQRQFMICSIRLRRGSKAEA